ncbi:MAG: hypothetical protein ABIG44_15775, partial [Planctomycetota bacterium]
MNLSLYRHNLLEVTTVLIAWLIAGAAIGCSSGVNFPEPVTIHSAGGQRMLAYDTDHDNQPDFWQYQNAAGRKHAIAYAADDLAEPALPIELDNIDATTCPHFMMVLDGVPFELVEELYQSGHFRFFHPPARVICCYPGMTDLALADLFHTNSCNAFQALYFDRQSKQLTGGSSAYLDAVNSPWVSHVDYRCSFWWDALVYLDPQAVFDHELRGMLRTFRARDAGEARAYSVGTAGLGTRGGREAILKYLRTVDRLCEQIIHERRGQVKLTLTADHGHNLTPNHKISFRKTLAAGGYRQSKSLRRPNDVVVVPYGLVTCAEFYTADPASVAECLLGHEAVELACYPTLISIRLGSKHFDLVVRDRHGQAVVTQTPNGFHYDSSHGDPLH